jgi:beta-glucosidase
MTDWLTMSRRRAIAGAAGLGIATQLKPAEGSRMLLKDFLWGTAISDYQSEGNNTNADAWLQENIKPTLFKERSGDACDS